MSKDIQDGLIIDNSIYIIDEKKPGFPISSRIIQYLAIIIGGWSSISIFLESLGLSVNIFQINYAILVCAGIVFALCLVPSYDIVKLFFGVLFYGLFFYSRLPALENAFYILENHIIDRIAIYYNYRGSHFVANWDTAIPDTTLLVIMILIPVITLLTVAIVRSRFVNLSSLFLFLPISISFAFGIIPSERYLIAYVAAILYLSRSGFSPRNVSSKEQKTQLHRINSRAAVWLSLMGALVFLFLKLFVTEENYEGITEIKEIKTKVQTALLDFSYEDFAKNLTDLRLSGKGIKATGGLSGGNLGNTGEVKFDNSDQLLITVPISSADEGIYLKGYVGSVYTGDKWEEHSKTTTKKYNQLLKQLPTEEFPAVNQVNLLLNQAAERSYSAPSTMINEAISFRINYQIIQGKLKLEYKGANKKFIYAPYFTNYENLDQVYYKQDLYCAPSKKKDSYEFDYYFNLDLSDNIEHMFHGMEATMGEYSKYEKLYKNFVYQEYTRLPEKGLERLKEDFSPDNSQVFLRSSVEDKIEFVKTYLDRNTSYSLSPGKLPKGKDFVEYFLYDNKIGYCAHYASAGTLMLRAMGIPARYVEGYAIGAGEVYKYLINQDQEVTTFTDRGVLQYLVQEVQIEVKDYNAHAWVEVYIDGCGWIPVEFTPGSAIDYAVVGDLSQVEEYLDESFKDQEIPSITPAVPTPPVRQPEQNQPQDKPKTQKVVTEEYKKEQARLDQIFLVIFIILMVTGISTVIIIKVRNKNKLINTRNHNKKALFLYLESERILTFCRCLPKKGTRLEDNEEYIKENCPYINPKDFEVFMDTVKKARFGKGRITIKELCELETFHRKLYLEVYEALPFMKKLYLKWILLIQS